MIKWIAGTAAGALVLGYLFKLNQASKSIQTSVEVKVHQVSLSGLVLKVYVSIKNPNNLSLAVQQPLVSLYYKGGILGSSQLKDEKINIVPNGETKFSISMQFGWLSLVQKLGGDIVDQLRNQRTSNLPLEIQISTQVNGIPFTATQKAGLNF